LSKYSLLYVENELHIRKMILDYLQEHFSIIYQANNGEEALSIYYDKRPDIIITDIEIPRMNGLEFAMNIRKNDDITPILITTEYTKQEYLLEAIELNITKYLIKPIQKEKLLEAIQLTFKKIDSNNPIVIQLTAQHKYDTYNKRLTCNDTIVQLTKSQHKLLDILIENRNRAVSYKEIENYIWIEKGMSEAALRSLVYDIRNIISKETIQNISKIGYQIKPYQ